MASRRYVQPAEPAIAEDQEYAAGCENPSSIGHPSLGVHMVKNHRHHDGVECPVRKTQGTR
jgi:hypothetical protein